MSGLFKKKLLNQKLTDYMIPNMDEKITLIQQRHDAQTKGILATKTETECEQAFNDDIFKQVLGYVSFPSNPFTIDPKGRTQATGQKPDAILGYYDPEKKNTHENTQVVVEIKDAKTPLDKSQRREGNLSPIQQGFKYKPQYTNCKRVITTNFIEIRLFKDNQLDYEMWTLADLVNPKNDYYQFKRFYYLLSADNLISTSGVSHTEKLLSEVRIEQEQITKNFYKEYKQLRRELINDMRTNNPDTNLETIIEKAQKVIDRLIFVHFCEDLDLLPENKLAEVVAYADNLVGVPVWQILQGYFEAVNSGSAKLQIPDGYNGGLFHPDAELNALTIGDSICRKFVDIGVYDFAEDLSVNILGHIFEQSISDIEELKIDLLGTQLETGELGEPTTQTSKRKKDGIFYTPEYIVDHIVKHSLGAWLEEQFETLKKKKFKQSKQMKDETYLAKEKELYREYQQILQNVKVLDPACGSGAFLVKVFDYLLEENVRVMHILSDGQEGLFDPYDMAKSILINNIFGVDLNAESVEITKLSLWLKTAHKGKKLADLNNNIKCGNSLINDPTVAGDKAFIWEKEFADIMSAGGFDVVVGNPPYGAKLSKTEYKYLQKRHIKGAGETAIAFLKLGNELLNTNGKLNFIIPKSYIYASNYKTIRDHIIDGFDYIVDCGKVWKEVKLEEIIIGYTKNIKSDTYLSSILNNGNIEYISKIRKTISKKFGFIVQGVTEKEINIGIGISNIGGDLNEYCSNSRGGIFQKYIKENGEIKVLGGGEIQRHGTIGIKGFVNHETVLNDNKATVNPNSVLVQRIIAHITKPKHHLKITACIPQYRDFVIVDTINQITPTNNEVSMFAVRAVLNSKLINRYLYRFVFGLAIRTMQFDNPVTSRLPITKEILSNSSLSLISKKYLNELNDFESKLKLCLDLLSNKYGLKKISKKLQSFYELDFPEFKKQLKIKKLSLEDEEELLSYFTKKKIQLLELKAQIDTLDREIDVMVFDLYGLTDEERKIVLDG